MGARVRHGGCLVRRGLIGPLRCAVCRVCFVCAHGGISREDWGCVCQVRQEAC